MGFHRTIQPPSLDRKAVTALVARAVAQELATLDASTPADPFLIDHDCLNRAGHDFIASCGDVVCVHCARVVWG